MNQTDLFPRPDIHRTEGPRLWVPSIYVDEISPPGRPSPQDWLARLDDGAPCLAPAEIEPEDPGAGRTPVALGEIVKFQWTQDFGLIEVTVSKDGTFTAHQQPHAEATHFCLYGDSDTTGYGLAEFARCLAQNGLEGEEERFVVHCYTWSDDVPHVLVSGSDGLRFAPNDSPAAGGAG